MTSGASETFPVDLHVHSLVSDGRTAPDEVVSEAAASGVRVLVFADHSWVTFDRELVEEAGAQGVEMPFPGVEVSTFHGERRHHVLCYGWAVLDQAFRSKITLPIDVKNVKYRATVDALRADGVPIPPFEDVMRGVQPDGSARHPYKTLGSTTLISRYVAGALAVDEAAARTVVERAAERVAGPPLSLRERYLPTLEVIDLARSAGAVAVLAHPLWRGPRTPTSAVIEDLEAFAEAGVAGVETRSYHHPSPGEDPELVAAAERLGLIRFGGSDYHANGKTRVGANGLTEEDFERIRALPGLERSDRDAPGVPLRFR